MKLGYILTQNQSRISQIRQKNSKHNQWLEENVQVYNMTEIFKKLNLTPFHTHIKYTSNCSKLDERKIKTINILITHIRYVVKKEIFVRLIQKET